MGKKRIQTILHNYLVYYGNPKDIFKKTKLNSVEIKKKIQY